MSIDKREDVGEFYPGGKVVTTRPIAGGADMKHEDFSDVAALPSRFTDDMVHDKINELIGLLKGPSAAVALLLCVAAFGAGVTVQTAPKGEVYNDEPIVTNVTWSADGLATTGEVESVRVELGSVRVGLESVSNEVESVSNDVANLSNSIDFSTSNATLVATIEATAPVPGDYETVSNQAMNAATKSDATLKERFSEWTCNPHRSPRGSNLSVDWSDADSAWVLKDMSGATVGLEPAGTATSTSLAFEIDRLGGTMNVTATRTALPGYQLGSQTNKLLASEAEAETLRNDVAARPTKTQIDEGWWKWEFNFRGEDAICTKLPFYSSEDGWFASFEVRKYGEVVEYVDRQAWVVSGEGEDATELEWTLAQELNTFTATLRHIAGQTPTKTSELENDGDGESPFVTSNALETATSAVSAAVPPIVTNIVQDLSLGGIWDAELEVWWTPRMKNGSLTYEATTNVNLNAGN